MEQLNTLSIMGLASLFNDAIANHSLDAKPVTKFGSKAQGIARVMKLANEFGLELVEVNDELALVKDETKSEANEQAEDETHAEPEAKVAKRRGPAPEFTDEMIVHLLVENPKRPGSKARARFAGYVDGMTIAQAIAAGLNRDDFRWDTDHGFISIETPESPVEAEDEAEAQEEEVNS